MLTAHQETLKEVCAAVSGNSAREEKIAERIEPSVVESGCDLEEVTLTRMGPRSLLRIVVDRDNGVPLDVVAELSKKISAVLDADASMFSTPYTLEVSSPGVDRPLRLPRHWRRNKGRLVRTRVGDAEILGRITEATDESVTLDVDSQLQQFRYDEVTPGKVQIEFSKETRK